MTNLKNLILFSFCFLAVASTGYAQGAAGQSSIERTLRDSLSENAQLKNENKELKNKISTMERDTRVVANLNSILRNENSVLRASQAEFESTSKKAAGLEKEVAGMEKQNKDLETRLRDVSRQAEESTAENTKLKNDIETGRLQKEIATLSAKLKSSQDERDKALFELSRALKQKESLLRDSSLLHFTMGNEFFKQRDYKRAVEEFKRSIEFNPLLADAYYNLAVIYDDYLGDNVLALRFYRRYVELSPNAPDRKKVIEKMVQSDMKEKSRVDSPIDKMYPIEKK